MKTDDEDRRPISAEGERTVDGLSPDPGHDGRERARQHDPTNEFGERVVAGEGEYPTLETTSGGTPRDARAPGALGEGDVSDEEANELNAEHGGDYHNGAWPNPER